MPATAPTVTETCSASLRDLNLFVLHKLFLLDEAPPKGLIEIAEYLTGLHNKRPQTPYLSAYARLPGFTPSQLDQVIYTDRTLLRAHCMRGTVHLLPLSRYQTVLTATKGQLDGMYRRAFADLPEKPAIEAAVLGLIEQQGPLPRATIAAALPMQVAERDLYRLINELCTRGILVKTTVQRSWRSAAYDYELLSRWQPAIPAGETDQAAARAQLVAWYLAAYGPATLADIAWWTGLSQAQVRQALGRAAQPWAYTSFEALGHPAYILSADLERLRSWEPPRDARVTLLPSFDPYIMAYIDRERYIDQAHYDRVFKGVAGIIEPVILADGRIIGTWKYTLRSTQLDIEIFESLDRSTQPALDRAAAEMAIFLGRADAEYGAGDESELGDE